jgi:hypothetical protein
VRAAAIGGTAAAPAAAAQAAANAANTQAGGTSAAGTSCCGTGAAGGGTCCGGTASASAAPASQGAAVMSGGVQKISVDLSSGTYNPDTLILKTGVPAEITFGQSSGCTGIVQSQQLGFSEDLSSGPKTVDLDSLKPGTYSFSCGMGMVIGKIVVQ